MWRFCVDCWGLHSCDPAAISATSAFPRQTSSFLAASVCFCSAHLFTVLVQVQSSSTHLLGWLHSTSVRSRRTAVCLSPVVPPSLCCCLWPKLNEITGPRSLPRNQLAASRNLMLIFWIPQTFLREKSWSVDFMSALRWWATGGPALWTS